MLGIAYEKVCFPRNPTNGQFRLVCGDCNNMMVSSEGHLPSNEGAYVIRGNNFSGNSGIEKCDIGSIKCSMIHY